MASVMQAVPVADPIAEVLAGFSTRRVPLDYAYFKFNLPERGLALRVDIVIRRRRRLVQVRAHLYHLPLHASASAPDGGQVHQADYPLSAIRRDTDGGITVADIWLGATGSRGTIGPISWDLVFQSTGPLLDPRIIKRIQPFDLRFRSVPDVLMSGSISITRHGYSFSHESGMIGAYHGRALPRQWTWVSCNTFDQPGISLECMLLDSAVFGIPFWRAQVGYFHLRTPTSTYLLMHPFTGRVRLSGDRREFVLTVRPRVSEVITIHCVTPDERFHTLGDRVYTTLVGTCTIAGLSTADGTAGIERQDPARPTR